MLSTAKSTKQRESGASRQRRRVMCLAVLLSSAMGLGTQAAPPAGPPDRGAHTLAPLTQEDRDLLARIERDSGGASVSFHRATGRVRFVGGRAGRPIGLNTDVAAYRDPELAAKRFLNENGRLFGLRDAATETTVTRTKAAGRGGAFVRFQQLLGGVPVIGAELIVQTDTNANVLSVHGEALPESPALETRPVISSGMARATALDLTAKHHRVPAADLELSEPELWLYNPILLGPGPDETRLVWRLEVASTPLRLVRELVLVDAATGAVALHFNQAPHARYREIYDNNNQRSCGFTDCGVDRAEGQPPLGLADADRAYDYTGDTYDFFLSRHGRDALDGRGSRLKVVTRFCDPWYEYPCPFPGAGWTGQEAAFGSNWVADDVVAHELTHGVTDHESNLFYYMQSGALNEAFSDIWGEFIDQTNGRGNDSPAVRWLLGEDIDGTGQRNMKDPPASRQPSPDRVGSPYYWCDLEDNGGVHANSGIANKVAYLLSDGGTFNGRTISAIGMEKTARIFYETQANLLTSASDYNDFSDLLHLSCLNLIGTPNRVDGAVILSGDCQQVRLALDAAETHLPEPCDPSRGEAPLCPQGVSPQDLFTEDFEAGCARWSSTTVAGSNAWVCPASIYATSGTRHVHGRDLSSRSDSRLTMAQGVSLPQGTSFLHFRHAHGFESSDAHYDGGVVEYSTDGGTTWTDAGSLFDHTGYNGTISTAYGNPLGGRSAFVAASYGYYSSRLNLSPLAGGSVRLRFRIGADTTIADTGWFIDDVRIYSCGALTPNPLPVIASISPKDARAGGGDFDILVTGSDFVPASVVRWNGQQRATTFVDATQLRARIRSVDIANAGTATVTVFNPAPGGGLSNALSFSIVPPCPPPASIYSYSTGHLTNDDCDCPFRPGSRADVFTFTIWRRERVKIKLSSSSFDPLLYVVTPGGQVLQNDDCKRGRLDSCINLGSRPAYGTYVVYATSFRPAATGLYELKIKRRR